MAIRRLPKPPDTLGPDGAAEWRVIGKRLIAEGRLTHELAGILATYCEAIDTARQAARILRNEGLTYRGTSGPKAHPMIRTQAVAQQNALRFWQALGLVADDGGSDESTPGLADIY